MQASELSGCHDHHQLDAPVLEPSLDQHGLAAARMEPIVDPSLNQVFAGSITVPTLTTAVL